jgi:hypothetical protein
MDRLRKLELVQRSLGIKHKIKVHESMKAPETHEELSVMMLAKWELEDELAAIEQLISEARNENVGEKKRVLLRHGPKKSLYLEGASAPAPEIDPDDEDGVQASSARPAGQKKPPKKR